MHGMDHRSLSASADLVPQLLLFIPFVVRGLPGRPSATTEVYAGRMTAPPLGPKRFLTKAEMLNFPIADPGLRQDLKSLAGATTDDLGPILPDLPAQATLNDSDAPQ